jgi:prolyl-tRNA synthetase
MLLRHLIGRRYKETPGDATLASHGILLRGGYLRQVSNGIYSLLPLGLRVIKKIEAIVREEMDRIGGQEVLMPVVLPRDLWEKSGRYQSIGSELVRFRDRTGHDMVLAMTHEEAVVHLMRDEVNSYKSYPFMVYQLQTKFRDEPRSRGGLIRVREFTMKDAYSFHIDNVDLHTYYEQCAEAYRRIFTRIGIPEVLRIESDSGMMGGGASHEYTLLTDAGEDTVVICNSCGYAANREVATCSIEDESSKPLPLEKVATPGKKSIADISGFLSVPQRKCAKVVFFEKDMTGKPVLALIRGDQDVNEMKLGKVLGTPPLPATDATIRSTGAVPGYASAIGVTGCRIIVDRTIAVSTNLVCGANVENYHYLNFNLVRDVAKYELVDIAQVVEGERCPKCKEKLVFRRGIEVGNIFQLGSRYTEAMGMRYLDAEGKARTPVMGCYGIGIGRLMASIIEARHDECGPLWPASVAPFEVHLIAVNLAEEEKQFFSLAMYDALRTQGIDVLYDDRNERPGVQFADADLIGAPLMFICSKKNLSDKKVEWKVRGSGEKGIVDFRDAYLFAKKFMAKEHLKTIPQDLSSEVGWP